MLARPSAAILDSFLAALAIPFSLNQSIAASILPLVASKAFLQSKIPKLVASLNSFTNCAVIINFLLIFNLIYLKMRLIHLFSYLYSL